MEYRKDTIAAIATAPGRGAIALVRASGPSAIAIADRLFRSKKKLASQPGYSLTYGIITDPETGGEVDEVMVSVFREPHSFTGEDMVEISCHGGTTIPNKILDLLLRQGCRLSEKGEFSKRAFLNGKIDLTQAEAINDLIHTSTLAGSQLALSNLKGELSGKLEPIRQKLTFLLAKLETILDYPEEEIDDFSYEDHQVLAFCLEELESLLEEGKRSRKIASGFRVVLVGKTNVGKSSLLNRLAGEEKAIVSHFHGTTRDVIEAEITLEGLPVLLMDTAGIRENYEHEIEGYGIIKTQETLKKADLIILVLDPVSGFTAEDAKILEKLALERTIVGINKSDQASLDPEILKKHHLQERVSFSALTGEGIGELIGLIRKKLQIFRPEETSFYLNQRQDEALHKTAEALKSSFHAAQKNETLDIIAFELRRALNLLGEVMGFSLQEEVLETIFSSFCVGK